MPFEIQPMHILLIISVALIIFGPNRLPDIGRMLGRSIAEFSKGTREMTAVMRDEMNRGNESAHPSAKPNLTQPLPADNQFCIKCGAPNPSDALFCNRCGNSLSV